MTVLLSTRAASAIAALLSSLVLLTTLAVSSSGVPIAGAAQFELKPGDHICYVGNGLADRMQHDGYLETLIHSRFPKHQLVFRNLGYTGDEVTLRLRSKGFGSPDEHLTRCQATVVFAFFGYNESFQGKAGLDKFIKDLADFVRHTQSQKYDGKTAARVVLFSPIAHENLHDPNLPDGKANNTRLEMYTQAMGELAKVLDVPFVDLFHPTLKQYEVDPQPLTINGVHLNARGNRFLAETIVQSLFPGKPRLTDAGWEYWEPVRKLVTWKNLHWFNRYRTVDGYSIYGGRADLKFYNGQTNRVVMDREMEILDVMTANRDRAIWQAAQRKQWTVDDRNTPPFLEVITNKPGPLPGGKYPFLGGEEAIEKMTVAEGMKVQLFASEEMFPELVNPVQMAFDPKGRLWVAVWPTYPHWKPKTPMNDKILIFEDTNGDGRADKRIVFADGLHVPTGLEFYNGGVLVGQVPDLMFLKDTDGDDRADIRVRVLGGIDSADTHHSINSFVLDPGGALYFQEGTFHHTQVETPYGPPVRSVNAGVFRYEPRTQKFEVYVPYGFANPHGHVFGYWGEDFVTDGTGNVNYYGAAFSGHTEFPRKHPRVQPFYKQRTRPCPGTEILRSRHFPERNWGTYLDANVIGFQGILQYKIEEDGSGFRGIEIEPIVQSSDPNFRPVDLEVGPDGALYFLDWQNPLIGHMQHNLRDPNRDQEHGRIYRIYCPDRPLLERHKIAGAPIPALLDLLKEPEDRVRYRVKIELGARPTDQVIAAVQQWVKKLDPSDPDYEHHLLEALWVHQYHNVVNRELLKRVLNSPEPRARAAATRVLCYWRDRVSDAVSLLRERANDDHPRVRLEAVRACSFFRDSQAAEAAVEALKHPLDYFLDYTLRETMETLKPYWQASIAEGRPFAANNPAGLAYVLKDVPTPSLVKLPKTEAVCRELLTRHQVLPDDRSDALLTLAKLKKQDPLLVLVGLMEQLDRETGMHTMHVLLDLGRLLPTLPLDQISQVTSRFEKLARSAKQSGTRQVAWMMLTLARRDFGEVWAMAVRSPNRLEDLLRAVPLIPDAKLRESAWSFVAPLLTKLPPSIADKVEQGNEVVGRYVRIELPGSRRTLTLAEVEVFSEGVNVAPRGKARQSTTAHGGVASRAIDGNRSGSWKAGGQTHTKEGGRAPWWELDLGSERPVEAIVVFNRTDSASLGKRLDGFTLRVLDASRRTVFRKTGIPAPRESTRIELGSDLERRLREAAVDAVTYIPGHEKEAFAMLADFVLKGTGRNAAVRALQRIDREAWDPELATPLIRSLVEFIESVPPIRRTEAPVMDALQLAKDLTTLLPKAEAESVRRQLGDLGVTVILIRPVPHQMIYDRNVLYVEAGKPVEIVFENIDVMPHNLLIVQPGMLEKVGMAGELMQTAPDAYQRGFVPDLNVILHHTRLLQPRETQRLKFIAPRQPGEYPYLCTFPGHWRRMNGVMHVVPDLDAIPWEVRNPARKKVEGTIRQFVKKWSISDFATDLKLVSSGRNFERGKKVFTEAACVQCHRMNGEGGEVGPDLVSVKQKQSEGKMTRADLIREMLEPSFKMEDKFRTHVILTDEGNVYSGVIAEETEDTITLVDNPLQKGKKIVVEKDAIEQEKISPISLMPEGLLNTFTKEEILDLMAFLESAGNPNDDRFASSSETE